MLVCPIHKFDKGMGGEPEVVKGGVEGLVDVLVVLKDVLEEHGGFADTAGAFDADHPGLPVDLRVKVTFEAQVYLGYLAVIVVEKGL